MHDIDRFVIFEPHIDPRPADGFPLLHPYLEQVWLPILGPSAVLVLRNLGRHFGADLNPYEADLDRVAVEVGLGVGDGRHAPIRKVINRLIRYHHAAYINPTRIEIHALTRPVNERGLDKLPAAARHAHHLMTVEAVAR